jgi:hypothetical protein
VTVPKHALSRRRQLIRDLGSLFGDINRTVFAVVLILASSAFLANLGIRLAYAGLPLAANVVLTAGVLAISLMAAYKAGGSK